MIRILIAASLIALAPAAIAGPDDFHAGKIIPGYGKVASVSDAAPIAEGTQFKVSFDVAKAAEPGKTNRYLESAARFLNMHGEVGVPLSQMDVAIVVHGGAAMDLVTDARYGGTNANAGLIKALTDAGVTIQLCGQTAAYRDIAASDLLPGVTLSLSAMTAHAQLQQAAPSLASLMDRAQCEPFARER